MPNPTPHRECQHIQCWGKVNAQLNLLIRSTKKKKKIKTNLYTLQFQSVWLVTLVQHPTPPPASTPAPDTCTSSLRCLATTPGNKSTVIKFKSPKQQPTPVDKASNWRGRATRANDEWIPSECPVNAVNPVKSVSVKRFSTHDLFSLKSLTTRLAGPPTMTPTKHSIPRGGKC